MHGCFSHKHNDENEDTILKKQKDAKCPRVDIGGQAVLEGVMMKSPDAIAIAVRRPDKSIVIKRDAYTPISKKHKWMGWPFVRGSVSMCQMLAMGMRTLQASGDMSGMMDEEPSKFEKWLAKKLGKGVDKIVMGVAVVLAIGLSFGLFVLLPNLPATALRGAGWSLLAVNLISGLIRTALLIGYLYLCGRIPDMKRLFQYHGAEHKTVYCNENGLALTPENARGFTTLHPRCGTSFLLITFVLSIIFYSVVDSAVLAVTGYDLGTNYLLRVLSRVILLPIVAGISYETLKGLAHSESKIARALRWPGLMMQKLTTRQPDDGMLEVAIAAMNAALHGLPEGELTKEGYTRINIPQQETPEA